MQLTLAGVGSRFSAALVDVLIQGSARGRAQRPLRQPRPAERLGRVRLLDRRCSSSSSATTSRSRCSPSGRTPGQAAERAPRRSGRRVPGRLPGERHPQHAAADRHPARGLPRRLHRHPRLGAQPAARRHRRRHDRRARAARRARPCRPRARPTPRRPTRAGTWARSRRPSSRRCGSSSSAASSIDPAARTQLAHTLADAAPAQGRRRARGVAGRDVPRGGRRRQVVERKRLDGYLHDGVAVARPAAAPARSRRRARSRGGAARSGSRAAAPAGPRRPLVPAPAADRDPVPALRHDDERRGGRCGCTCTPRSRRTRPGCSRLSPRSSCSSSDRAAWRFPPWCRRSCSPRMWVVRAAPLLDPLTGRATTTRGRLGRLPTTANLVCSRAMSTPDDIDYPDIELDEIDLDDDEPDDVELVDWDED